MGAIQDDQAKSAATVNYSTQHPYGQAQDRPLYTPPPVRSSNVHRKVLAGTAGGSVGTNLAVILAYHFPSMPATVTAAYSGLLILILSFLTSYLTKAEGE